jgi:very-short-patch-repair endonuclease
MQGGAISMHNTIQRDHARMMRRNMTSAERIIWNRLKSRALGGHRFNRQVESGPYIIDFVCREKRVIFEVDGATHGETSQVKDDRRRTAFLESKGYKVVRAWNQDVYENLDAVLYRLLQVLEDRTR